MFFNPIKEINRLRKEIIQLKSKWVKGRNKYVIK